MQSLFLYGSGFTATKKLITRVVYARVRLPVDGVYTPFY
jgi:hypothetical protein